MVLLHQVCFSSVFLFSSSAGISLNMLSLSSPSSYVFSIFLYRLIITQNNSIFFSFTRTVIIWREWYGKRLSLNLEIFYT